MPTFAYRLSYDRPQPGTHKVLLASRDPVPTYVSTVDFLTKADFISVREAVSNGENVIRVTLTPGAREKFNQIAERNETLKDIRDHAMLLLYVNGEPASQVTILLGPISSYEFEIQDFSQDRLQDILNALNAKTH